MAQTAERLIPVRDDAEDTYDSGFIDSLATALACEIMDLPRHGSITLWELTTPENMPDSPHSPSEIEI